MKKSFVVLWMAVFALFPLSFCAGGGAKESGRASAYSGIDSGQFTEPQKIDASVVINDYPFPWEMKKDEDLSVFVSLEKRVLLCGRRVFQPFGWAQGQ